VSNNSAYGVCGFARLYSPGSSTLYKRVTGEIGYYAATGHQQGIVCSGAYLSATAVNAFRVLTTSGNIASGTIRVYGIAKS
jgi:hypothetical protein